MRALIGRLTLILFSLAFTLLLLEGFVRVAFDLLPPRMQGQIQNVRVVPWSEDRIVPPMPFQSDRGYQARIAPGYDDYPVRWMDARFTFDTVNLWDHPVGLRTSDSPRWPLDIIAFGDSFTFCWTAVEDCWVQQLQSEYGYSVINAGQPGTGPTGQLKLMQEVGVPVEPKLVIWQRYPNDSFDDYVLAQLRGEISGLDGPPAADPVLDLVGLQKYSAVAKLVNDWVNPPPKSNDYQHTQFAQANGRTLLIATDEYTHQSNLTYSATRYGWKRNLDAYHAGRNLMLGEVGAPIIFVFIPTKEEAYAEYLGDYLSPAYLDELGQNRRLTLSACETFGWHCIDTLPAFREAIRAGETVYYARDFHLDASGNAIVSQLVGAYIRDHNLLD